MYVKVGVFSPAVRFPSLYCAVCIPFLYCAVCIPFLYCAVCIPLLHQLAVSVPLVTKVLLSFAVMKSWKESLLLPST